MKNFAEELVYWYLRFNGFYPLTNFVLHRQGLRDNHQSADADLLAVRPKFVSEDVGGEHRDEEIFRHFSPLTNIGLICEVKSGNQVNWERLYLQREDRISYCLRRIGFFSENKVRHHTEILKSHQVSKGQFHEVGKLLVTKRQMNIPGFICLSMDHVEAFIMKRIDLFPHEKGGAKLHFDSDMIQYMIWKRGI
ncbi:hypothetical protein [Paenibacillus xylanivorans]|jgi:hypothetical protein|uniref:Uncharacterized protein n=1 Tax=Paenibacillus xylanivorans TaxID=1705561 RepID=A0A0M9BL64_9BACL|nr:hypothetical protein [Paenibacillus xylanivorans]KOY14209.1 hypothetical protein AMS66_22705 [Paenibacillus xylanivorans]